MKRTFQVAIFGASDAANKRTLTAMHRARSGELVTIPDGVMGNATTFFDYEVSLDRLHPRFRIRAVLGAAIESQAFLGLFSSDAVVFVPSGKQDAAAWRAAQQHVATYGDILILVAADRAPRGIDGIAVPPADLANAIEREVIASFRAGRVKGRPTTTPSKAYTTRANALAAAAQIAIDTGPRNMRAFHKSMRMMALYPDLGFATISSLASLEMPFFTYWNEAPVAKTDKFWREVAKRRLPFKRRDVIGEASRAATSRTGVTTKPSRT